MRSTCTAKTLGSAQAQADPQQFVMGRMHEPPWPDAAAEGGGGSHNARAPIPWAARHGHWGAELGTQPFAKLGRD